jgi:hypothetical protein
MDFDFIDKTITGILSHRLGAGETKRFLSSDGKYNRLGGAKARNNQSADRHVEGSKEYSGQRYCPFGLIFVVTAVT